MWSGKEKKERKSMDLRTGSWRGLEEK